MTRNYISYKIYFGKKYYVLRENIFTRLYHVIIMNFNPFNYIFYNLI